MTGRRLPRSGRYPMNRSAILPVAAGFSRRPVEHGLGPFGVAAKHSASKVLKIAFVGDHLRGQEAWLIACLLMQARSASVLGLTPSGPGNCNTAICGRRSSKPDALSSLMMRRWIA